MAIWHLQAIENGLTNIGYNISPRETNEMHWLIERNCKKQIDFYCWDHWGNSLPFDQAFACQLSETKIDLYFYKKGNQWKTELKKFIESINKQ